MKVEEVRKCSFQNWYDDFKNLSIKSIILPLPDGFVAYLLKDGIVLPKGTTALNAAQRNSDSDTDEEDVWEENSDIDEPEAPQFSEFDKTISEAIGVLGGKVFPKLNWSSPRDASWIAFNNCCCCTSVSDIYLLLKSSDFITHDLTQRMMKCEDYSASSTSVSPIVEDEQFYLVLRKWIEMDTAGEFRCFVNDNNLIGICQREHSLYFHHISQQRNEIVEDIVTFFRTHIQHKFPSDKYVFDVYRRKKAKVVLIDFNPFGKVTDSLLFSWKELTTRNFVAAINEFPEFRYVDDNRGVQPSTLSHYALPRDIVDISNGEDSFKLVDLLKLRIEDQNGKSDADNEDNWEV